MELAGFIVGTSGLTAIVDKAFAIAQTIEEVRHFPEDMQQSLAQLANESHKIYIWSLEALVAKKVSTPDSSKSRKASELRSAVEKQMARCIVQIESELENSSAILKKIGMGEIQTPPTAEYNVSSGIALILSEMKIHPDPILVKQRLEKRQTEIFLKRSIPGTKKLLSVAKPWGVPTKQELDAALRNLKYWNGEIWSLISDQRQLAMQQESAANILAFSTDEISLQIIETSTDNVDISKSAALALEKLKADKDEAVAPSDTLAIAFSLLRFEPPHTNLGTLSRPDFDSPEVPVYVEWLDYSGLQGEYLDIAKSRIRNLCNLLATQKPEKLPTLKALGYTIDRSTKQFGLLFDAAPHNGTEPLLITLRQLMSPKGDERVFSRPTLKDRFTVARQLSAAFLELHKARWLHKGFNPESVVFHKSHIKGVGRSQQSIIDIESFAISGFQYARPIGRDQVSLPLNPSGMLGMEIYHHPSIRENFAPGDIARDYVKYEAKHDIYSLGLVLLEIGVWKPLHGFYKEGQSAMDFSKRIANIARTNLPHSMGSGYAEVVLRCLEGPSLEGESMGGLDPKSKERFETMVEINWLLYEIVKPLEDCQCR